MIELKRQSFTTDSVNKENIMEIKWLNTLFIFMIVIVLMNFIVFGIMDFIFSFQSKIDKWKRYRWKQKVGLKEKK